jgi:hypothetical protein
VLELTHSGFGLVVPMMAATVIATAVAFYLDGYLIYSARLPAYPDRSHPGLASERPESGADGADEGVHRVAGTAADRAPDALGSHHGEVPD